MPGTFESMLTRLEEINALMEAPATTLDVSINLFREGIELIEALDKRLSEARLQLLEMTVGTGEDRP